MVIAYVAFGSNKGDRSKNIAKALDAMRNYFTVVNMSSFYMSDPVYTNQNGAFINGVIKIETELEAKAVYDSLKNIEMNVGRINIPRDDDKVIDLDLIYYGNKTIDKQPVVVPHHKAHARKYVLIAMNELDPDFVHPILGKTQRELLSELSDKKEVKKIPGI